MKVYDPYSNTFYDNSEKLQTVASDRTVSLNAVIDAIEYFQMNPQHFDFVNLIDDIKELPSVGKEINVPTTDYISRQAVFAQLVAGMERTE